MKQLHEHTAWYGSASLLLNLWEEGLASYVSFFLNPKANYAELMLDLPENLPERTWRDRTFLTSDLARHLESEDGAVYRKYFRPWTNDERVPGRAGCFLGFVVISELAKQISLSKLLLPESEDWLLERVKTQLLQIPNLPDAAYPSS